jgi:hypothetical protein
MSESALVEWNEVDVKQAISRHVSKDEEGKRQTKTSYRDVKFNAPRIKPLQITRLEDIAIALAELQANGHPAYKTLSQIVAHVNYGLLNNPLRILRQGHDYKVTDAQRQALNMYAKLYLNGFETDKSRIVSALLTQGIEDAEELFDAVVQAERDKDGNPA